MRLCLYNFSFDNPMINMLSSRLMGSACKDGLILIKKIEPPNRIIDERQ